MHPGPYLSVQSDWATPSRAWAARRANTTAQDTLYIIPGCENNNVDQSADGISPYHVLWSGTALLLQVLRGHVLAALTGLLQADCSSWVPSNDLSLNNGHQGCSWLSCMDHYTCRDQDVGLNAPGAAAQTFSRRSYDARSSFPTCS
jgi:hypothetical protein